MNIAVRALVALAGGWLAVSAAAQAADPIFDLVPLPGAPPAHLRVELTTAGPYGPQSTTADVVIRRTGPANASLQKGPEFVPLSIGSDGSLKVDVSGPTTSGNDVTDLLAVLNIAHGVTGVPGAGSRAGWSAQVPLPPRKTQPDDSGVDATPANSTPLVIPVHTFGTNPSGGFDIDGFAQTTLAAPVPEGGAQRTRGGGGGFGGFGGFGGRGGFGGGRGGGGGARRAAAPPITLDVHVSGHVEHGALARMTIVQTRTVELEGLSYSNVSNATIDVVHEERFKSM